MNEPTAVREHELHEHAVRVDALPGFLDAHGDWYLNGAMNFYGGHVVWGYAEHAVVDSDRADLIVVTLTDPMKVAAFRTTNPITDAPVSLTLSKSFREPASCPVCRTTDHRAESSSS